MNDDDVCNCFGEMWVVRQVDSLFIVHFAVGKVDCVDLLGVKIWTCEMAKNVDLVCCVTERATNIPYI